MSSNLIINRLLIKVNNLPDVMTYYTHIKVYRASSEEGEYSEITDAGTRIALVVYKDVYWLYDQEGDSSSWYKTSFYNTDTQTESGLSEPAQVEGYEKIGYTFGNYTPPPGEWGEVLTPDDMRFHYVWGVDMIASDSNASSVDDEQLRFAVKSALEEFEKFFDLSIRKRVYKTEPAVSLKRSPVWREGVDYTDEEDPYDFRAQQWEQYGFIQLRHRPIISIESAKLYSVWNQQVLDVLDWIRLYKIPGQIHIYPKGSWSGTGYVGSGIIAASPSWFTRDYPHGFKIDYTAGFLSSDFVPADLRNAIGMLAALNILGWMGDGLMAGFSSSSISLDGLSESFSSTQSATSAYFGARIKSYLDQLKEFKKTNRLKYGNLQMGMING